MGILEDVADHHDVDNQKFKSVFIEVSQGKKNYQVESASEDTVTKYRDIFRDLTRRDILMMMSEISHSELKSSLAKTEPK